MGRNNLGDEYFNWMYQLVCDNRYSKRTSYRLLLNQLDSVTFTYTIGMDGNRAADGEDLRYRFGDQCGYSDREIAAYLDVRPCSVLEMMIALSIRCEEHIMEDSEVGDRTGQWFWNMIVSLGLGSMIDSNYNIARVDRILDRFLNRKYKRNGEGGLFTVEHNHCDMRTIEIWYQMFLYLDEFLHVR